MTTEIQKKPVDILKSMLNAPSVQQQFKNALAESKDLFIASIIDLYNGDRSLQACEASAIVSEALKAAVLKLPINKALGFSYIVAYNTKKKVYDAAQGRDVWTKVPTPTFILGYKGYLQLAQRTGQYRTINADVVYEGQLVNNDLLSGEIVLDGTKRKSDKVIGYFAHFKLLNGFTKTLYMDVRDMAVYAKRYSPSVGRDTSVEQLVALANTPNAGKGVGWEGNFNDMALKTCVRRLLSKYGILSIEMQTALVKEAEMEQHSESENIIPQSDIKEVSMEDAEFEEVADNSQQPTSVDTSDEPDF